MRERFYLAGVLLLAGALTYLGRDLLERSEIITLGLTFAGTTAAGVFGMALYRVQAQLRASRMELARKQAELNFAREVQEALFPREFPGDSLEFSGVCVPAAGISGDYYDVLELPDGRIAFAIADISGKGISAAILMSNLHAMTRALVHAGLPLAETVAQLNCHLHQVSGGSRFATFFYAVWNPADRSLHYINAGHNAPILISSGPARRLLANGPPLGIMAAHRYPVNRFDLRPGGLLVLFSDGIPEAGVMRDKEFGEARLQSLVAEHASQPLEEIQRIILRAVREWAPEDQEDDITLLLVRVTRPAEGGV
jgi:sigma-B regulation protein RsbU (phosphoserine phosphatase)